MKPLLLALPLLVSLAAFADGPDRPSREEARAARARIVAEFGNGVEPTALKDSDRDVLKKYDYVDPKHEVPEELLQRLILFFDGNKAKFANQKYFSIVDFGPRSDEARFYVIDIGSGAVEKFHTTHGEGSDRDRDGVAESFSNVEGSYKSSLGFARTAETYVGTYKRSLRLDGLSSTNSKLRDRAIVVHGWDYAFESDRLQGLTQGCVALDWSVKDAVVDKLKNGSLMLLGVSKP